MVSIREKTTGHVKQVTKNVAFDLVDKGTHEVVEPTPKERPQGYLNRQVRSKQVINK